MKKITSILLAMLMIFAFAGCGADKTEEPATDAEAAGAVVQEAESTTEKATETTTEATTETTTAAPKDGENIQQIIDTLESKTFYMAGVMKLAGGDTINMKMTCDGDDYRMEMDSKQMKITMYYIGGVPYIANNTNNLYAVIDDAAIDSLDQVLNSFSSYGISFTGAEMTEMKSMMSSFDQNMDYSQYINNGEYSEYNSKINDVEHLCSVYKTEYGTIRIYTLEGELKVIEVYDSTGLQQMNMEVSAFIPQVLTPISLNGLTMTGSILNVFSIM